VENGPAPSSGKHRPPLKDGSVHPLTAFKAPQPQRTGKKPGKTHTDSG